MIAANLTGAPPMPTPKATRPIVLPVPPRAAELCDCPDHGFADVVTLWHVESRSLPDHWQHVTLAKIDDRVQIQHCSCRGFVFGTCPHGCIALAAHQAQQARLQEAARLTWPTETAVEESSPLPFPPLCPGCHLRRTRAALCPFCTGKTTHAPEPDPLPIGDATPWRCAGLDCDGRLPASPRDPAYCVACALSQGLVLHVARPEKAVRA